jgi:hypothetical protein
MHDILCCSTKKNIEMKYRIHIINYEESYNIGTSWWIFGLKYEITQTLLSILFSFWILFTFLTNNYILEKNPLYTEQKSI